MKQSSTGETESRAQARGLPIKRENVRGTEERAMADGHKPLCAHPTTHVFMVHICSMCRYTLEMYECAHACRCTGCVVMQNYANEVYSSVCTDVCSCVQMYMCGKPEEKGRREKGRSPIPTNS